MSDIKPGKTIKYAFVTVLILCTLFALGGCKDSENYKGEACEYVSIYLELDQDIEYINAQKGNTASGRAIIYDNSGNVLYDGGLKQIKGRGNTSWTYVNEQKPYNIKLEEKAELIKDSGAAKKWCLISGDMYNEYAKEGWVRENPNLTSLIGYNFYKDLGGDNALDCIPAQLYINGDYRGCYILSEAVQIGEGRVELNDGGVILELDNSENREKDDISFTTTNGNRFLFKDPDEPSEEMIEKVSAYVQEFEDAVYNADGTNIQQKYYTEYVDIESFVKEISTRVICADGDIYLRSAFFTIDVDGNGEFQKIKAGPVWDFDCCTYNNTDYLSGLNDERLAKRQLLMMLLMHVDFAEELDEFMVGPAKELMTQYADKDGKINFWIEAYSDIKAESFERWPKGIDWNASASTPNSAKSTYKNFKAWRKFFYEDLWENNAILNVVAPVYVMVKNN